MDCPKFRFMDLPELDRNIIKDIPWAKNMWTVLQDGLNKTFLHWCEMVLKIGENEDLVNEWVNVFISTYEETCCELVTDMERVQRKVLSKIEQMLQKIQKLCYTLQIDIPVLGDATRQLSLNQEQEQLKKLVDEYEKLIEMRSAELDTLHKKQLDLCNSLGREPKILNDNPLPSSNEVEEFQRFIEKLEVEKFNRLEKFVSLKEDILEIVNELNVEPCTQFEKDVFSLDDSIFLVTDDNMQQLDRLHKSLIKQQKKVREEIAQLRNKVNDYWSLLDVDLKEREDFKQKYAGNSQPVLEALRTEVKRCEELKKANIKVFIDKLRLELEQLWEKCHCSENMRDQFGFYYSDCYNEDLLELYEVETAKWKKYYEENKELLTLLEKHQRLWKKMVEFEENATGPNRYNNRGGQLLKEEKERNKLAKQIPQIEDMLYNLAVKYLESYNNEFTTFGTTVQEYLANLHEERENAKKEKLSARKMQREQTLTPAKSAISLFPSTSTLKVGTPMSTTKRKLATPLRDETKKPKILSERKNNKINRTPAVTPIIKITSVSGLTKRRSVDRKKRIDKIRRLSAQKKNVKKNPNFNETFVADYGEFQNDLSNKDDCRSTIIPSVASTSNAAPACTPISSRTLRCRTPTNILQHSPRTPLRKTPTNLRLRPRTPEASNQLSAAKSNIKLIF